MAALVPHLLIVVLIPLIQQFQLSLKLSQVFLLQVVLKSINFLLQYTVVKLKILTLKSTSCIA